MLPLHEGANKYHVLSVGLIKKQTPVVTIMIDGKASCYRIPDEYRNWAFDCMKLSRLGPGLFPSDIIFTLKNKKYFVDIL